MTNPPNAELLYLLLVENPIVAIDIAETIREHRPGAAILVAEDLAEAARLIADHGPVEMAVFECSPPELAVSGLGRAIEAGGGRVVLIGDRAEESPPEEGVSGWRLLLRPFVSEDIATLLLAPC